MNKSEEQLRLRKLLMRQANELAHEVLARVGYSLTDAERDILRAVSTRLIAKYFRGEALEMLTAEGLATAAVDLSWERSKATADSMAYKKALAKLLVVLDEFFNANATEATV